MKTLRWTFLLGALAVVACKGGSERTGRSADSSGSMGHMDSAGMGMAHGDSGTGMGNMNMQATQMMPGMRAHMDSMARMTPSQMKSQMATHEAIMSQMMDRMGADMRQMNMKSSPEWTALTDSVKQDLAELPNLDGQQLSAALKAHANRVKRLIGLHESMMGK